MTATGIVPVLGPTMPLNLHPSPPLVVHDVTTFSPGVRVCIRVTIFFLVVLNAALLALFAVLYMQNDTSGSLVWLFRIYFLYWESNVFLMANSSRVALGYAVLSSLFVVAALRILWQAVSSCKTKATVDQQRGSSSYPARPTSKLHKLKSTIKKLISWYKKWNEAVGIRGPYFDVRLLAGEVIEIATQTAAALSASQSISNLPLNLVYAVVIFLNSISSFVFRRVFKKSLVKERIASLLTDLVLDFVWGTLLPIWMYIPIVKIWIDRVHILDYLDSFANSTREVERVLIISWKLYLLSVVPFCNSLLALLKLHSTAQEIARTRTLAKLGLLPANSFHPTIRRRPGVFMRLAHVLLPVYGVVVLVIALTPNGMFSHTPQHHEFGCMHRVHPWFSTKEACLGREINCTTLGLQVGSHELDLILERFDESSLADLFLISCPQLEIPPKIQSFHRLMSIVVKDSTIVQWTEAAMLDDSIFHELRAVQLKNVVIEKDPVGLVGVGAIASSVEWIHLENVDGTRLLSLVGGHWKNLIFFDCMWCGLSEIPEALYQMPRLLTTSLAFNELTSIPEDWMARSQVPFQFIWLDGNWNLTALPDSMWRLSETCGVISMSSTNLSIVPTWIADVAAPRFRVTAVGTPVCVGFDELPAKTQSLVVCTRMWWNT